MTKFSIVEFELHCVSAVHSTPFVRASTQEYDFFKNIIFLVIMHCFIRHLLFYVWEMNLLISGRGRRPKRSFGCKHYNRLN